MSNTEKAIYLAKIKGDKNKPSKSKKRENKSITSNQQITSSLFSNK